MNFNIHQLIKMHFPMEFQLQEEEAAMQCFQSSFLFVLFMAVIFFLPRSDRKKFARIRVCIEIGATVISL